MERRKLPQWENQTAQFFVVVVFLWRNETLSKLS